MFTLSALKVAELSTLSNLAYQNHFSGSVYGWQLVDEFSIPDSNGFAVSTYKRGNEIVIAFRGTDSVSDAGSDASFLTGA